MPGVSVLRRAGFSRSNSPSCHPLFIKSMPAKNQSITILTKKATKSRPLEFVFLCSYVKKPLMLPRIMSSHYVPVDWLDSYSIQYYIRAPLLNINLRSNITCMERQQTETAKVKQFVWIIKERSRIHTKK